MTAAWHERPLIAFDLETTAAEPEVARIVSGSLATIRPPEGGGEGRWSVGEASWLVNPGVPVPEEAASIHGITTERVQADGVSALDGVTAIVTALEMALEEDATLVIFNASYDLTVLDREARRVGIQPLQEAVAPLHVVDPSVLDRHLDRYRPGKRTLAATCATYGAALGGAHDATHDALAAARLAWAIGKHGRIIRRVRDQQEREEFEALHAEWERVRHDLPALHEAQVGWAEAQRRNLAEHFRKVGAAKDVPVAWPLIPVREGQQGALL